jgi:hypothetical protein
MKKLEQKGHKVKILGNKNSNEDDEIRDDIGEIKVGIDEDTHNQALRAKEEEMNSKMEQNMAELQKIEREKQQVA